MLKDKYNVLTLKGSELSSVHTDLELSFSETFEVYRVEVLISPIPFSLKFNDVGNDKIYVPNAPREIADEQQIRTIFFSNATTVATSTPIKLLLQGL